ncbi:MAG: glycosyltransferase family 39 protein [Planctomycetes bacterium]|nr:glycosyltransferase family 39 protein [Planctomycetota bacterium]
MHVTERCHSLNGSAAEAQHGAERRTAKRTYAAIVGIVLCVGVLLRFVALDQLPLPAHQDELSDIYDGYCIAMTGADRAGDPWPIIIRGMGPGDYHPGLYAYLAGLSTRLLGLSVWAGRLPAVLAGSLTLLLVFFAAIETVGRRGALIALLFLVFSPVHILYSRQAHAGACLPPFFAALTLFLLLRSFRAIECGGARSPFGWIFAAGLAIGTSTNAYGALRLSGVLFAIAAAALVTRQVGWRFGAWRRAVGLLTVLTLATLLGAAPQIYAALGDSANFFARAFTVVPSVGNGMRWWGERLMANFAANLDPRHLYFSFGEHRLLTVARLSLVSLPFLYVGLASALYRTVIRRHLPSALVLLTAVICLAPAVASRPNPHPLRASGVWAVYPILSAIGAVAVSSACVWLWRLRRIRARSDRPSLTMATERLSLLGASILGVAITIFGFINVVRYLGHTEWHGPDAQYHLHSLAAWLDRHDDGFDRVYVDVPGLFPYLYFAFYSEMSPDEFRSAPREGMVTAHGWEQYQRFGKFYFANRFDADRDWSASDRKGRWLFLAAEGEVVEYGPTEKSSRYAKDGRRAHAADVALLPRPHPTGSQ